MKKMLLPAMLLLATSTGLFAQDNNEIIIRASKPITKELAPKVVVDSLNNRFPDASAIQYFKTSPTGVQNGWNVTEQNTMNSDAEIDHYTISFKRDNMKYFGLYRADGTLLKSKQEQTEAALPDAVKQSLRNLAGTDYKSYKLLSTSYLKTTDYGKKSDFYEVTAVKGSTKKTVFVKPDGTVIKVK
ncbi:hypothetical protein [Deminuibacter soli]|uniref:Beta-lactamase-inhibitor-like PepSY-like domain-containing protein n=1 Tax=Deminuibacter soli TaxID=2291815 RepID=A0A3E1NHE3_9BACT|nr:hypothetical protein [Deminuibacter soli]RFM27302.1 hypothetical protein DXN05_14840 [Deminuibacter soli]